MKYTTRSEQETKKIGKQIAATLAGGDIVALHGDLGAGKTTFVKGLAEGLGLKEDITSPTFTLMNVYTLNPTPSTLKHMVHIDTYRLKNEQELIDIGVEDYLGNPETVCIIEWPEKISELLRNRAIMDVTLTHVSQNERRISYEHFTKTP